MSSSELIDEEGCLEESPEVLYPPDTRVNNMFLSDPDVLPRVGDEYQAEVPTLMPVLYYIRITESRIDRKTVDGFHHEISTLSPTLVTLVKEEDLTVKHEPTENLGVSFELVNQIGPTESGKNEDIRESCECKADIEMVTDESEGPGIKVESLDTVTDEKKKLGELFGSGKPRSDTEETVFLLSLYIFRKNFDQVKRFIECMKMEDILSHYYGSFYGSIKYHKWKKKCKRRMYGAKIFSGLRQKELLSRLLPRSSEDCQQTMIEVSKTFGEGSISLEEYVFTLKSMVGIKNLTEAVGLGKNKQDLTRITRESLRSSQGFPVRAEIPMGKDCAALTAENIVKFLTGDFRLSKAKSSDLFWEAVWPRLLARGWTSLQPKDRNYVAGGKHSLVFLMPGIKKFSRRKLTKGDDYFDSVADVLSKVASEPDLLELEGEAGYKANELTDDEKLTNGHELSDQQQRHQYLQPKIAAKRSDRNIVQITVIDTSLAHGEKVKIRELKSLNVAALNSSWGRSKEVNRDSSEEAIEESDHANDSSCFNKAETIATNHTSPNPNQDFLLHGPFSAITPGKFRRDHNTSKCNDTKPRKSKKSSSNESDDSVYMSPGFKRRRRLSACGRPETKHRSNGFLSSPRLKHEESQNSSNILDPSPSLEHLYEKLLSSISWQQNEPIENNESTTLADCHAAVDQDQGQDHDQGKGQGQDQDQPHEETQLPTTMFDLNVDVPPEPESNEPVTTQMTEKQVDASNTVDDIPANVAISTEQQPNINSRRQGTRNRPPTTKALEAFAHGYLSVKKERKKRGEKSGTGPYKRRVRAKTGITKNRDTSIDDESKQDNDVWASSSDTMFSECQSQPEVKVAQLSAL